MPIYAVPPLQVSNEIVPATTATYVARARETGDTPGIASGIPSGYRVWLGIDANDRGALLFGLGATNPVDLRIRHAGGAGTLTIDTLGAAAQTLVQVRATAGQTLTIDGAVVGDTGTRFSIRGDATVTGIQFGSGSANDVNIYRSAANVLKIDADLAGGSAMLDLAGELDLITDWTTTKPASPTTGSAQYTNAIVNTRWPSAMLPSGNDFPFDIAPWMMVTWQIADGNGTNVSKVRAPALVYTGTQTSGGTIGTGSYQAAHPWVKAVSAGTANSQAEIREGDQRFFLGNAANMGGFYINCVFTLSKAGSTADRIFVGLSGTNAALANTDPSALLNLCGVACDTGDTANLQFMHNGSSGTGVKTDLGANFTKASLTNVYMLELWAAPNTASPIYWAVSRRDVTNVTPQRGNFSASIVAVNTLMNFHLSRWNVAAVSSEVGLYSLFGWSPG